MPKRRQRSENEIVISGHYSASEFAEATDTPYEVVLEGIRAGRIRAERVGSRWFKIPIEERARIQNAARTLTTRQ